MKKLINTALVYLIAGAAAGVFFREFTNFAQFTGQTTLGLMHPHLLVLGFAVFLIATLFALQDDFTGDKLFKPFYIVYNVGLVVTVCMMLVRGVVEVTGAPLAMPDAAISGIAGIGHILIGVGLVLLTVMFKRVVNRKAAAREALRPDVGGLRRFGAKQGRRAFAGSQPTGARSGNRQRAEAARPIRGHAREMPPGSASKPRRFSAGLFQLAHKFGAVVDIALLVNMAHMGFHRCRRDDELLLDVLRAVPRHPQSEHLLLARR